MSIRALPQSYPHLSGSSQTWRVIRTFKDDPTTPTRMNVFEDSETFVCRWGWLYVDNGNLSRASTASLSVKHDSPDLRTAEEDHSAPQEAPNLSTRGLKLLDVLVGDVFKGRRQI